MKALALGLDLGSTRVRLACAERAGAGQVRLTAVASRDLPEDAVSPQAVDQCDFVSAILEDLWRELGTRERRCAFSVGAEVASMRLIRFPPMSSTERRQAARFEAERFAGWDTNAECSTVRVHPVQREERIHAVGVVRDAALQSRLACVKQAGLRPVGVDYDAYVLHRAFPFCDAVLDVGHRNATLHAYSPAGPMSFSISHGGLDITRAIAADLSIDVNAAEKRKRHMGTAGAGESARDEFAASVGTAVAKARERFPALRRIAATGNGSRLPGLANAIEAACGATMDVTVSDVLRRGSYPDDVVRAAAPDWTLAACLAGWGRSS